MTPLRSRFRQTVVSTTIAVFMTAAAAALAGDDPRSSQRVEEDRLKAGFLYNFLVFVEWPSDAFSHGDSPFLICVAGDDRLGDFLDQTIRRRTVNGRALTTVRLRAYDEVPSCHLLYLGESQRWQLAQMQERIANRSVMTVGESTGFAEDGGVAGLVMDEDHVRIDINLKAAARARLKISSRLLTLAHVIREPPRAAGK